MRRLARENPLWGAERIRGEMLKLNMEVAKSSIQKYTQEIQRVGPAGQDLGDLSAKSRVRDLGVRFPADV
jgi:hypothetical protein